MRLVLVSGWDQAGESLCLLFEIFEHHQESGTEPGQGVPCDWGLPVFGETYVVACLFSHLVDWTAGVDVVDRRP